MVTEKLQNFSGLMKQKYFSSSYMVQLVVVAAVWYGGKGGSRT